jgi:uncharacterized protein YciI
MKHFIVDINYLVPAEQLADILPAHRAFLHTGYEKGILFMSGPKEPRTGGLAVARSESLKDLQEFFTQDPYHLNNVATHTFIEFNPVLRQSWLDDWVDG